MDKTTAAPIGRRSGKSDTRKNILAAARELFAEDGYSNATIQKIAARVGVDPSLVIYFFKNKQMLFVEAVAPAYNPLSVLDSLTGADFSELGERLATFFVDLLEDPQQGQIAQGLLRAVMAEPTVQDILEASFRDKMTQVVGAIAPGKDARLRANLVCAVYTGLLTLRYVSKVEPIASLSAEATIRCMAPLFQQCLIEVEK